MGLLPVTELGAPAEERQYYPYLLAQHKGIDLPEPGGIDDPPGVILSNGRIPSHKQAGLVTIGDEFIGAFDHFAAEFHPDRIDIYPASKTAVTDEGEIIESGVIGLLRPDGRLKIASLAINALQHPWLLERYRRKIQVGWLRGEVIVVPANVLEMPEYATGLHSQADILVAKPRQKFF